jgi:hypothetical protein
LVRKTISKKKYQQEKGIGKKNNQQEKVSVRKKQ